MEQQAGTVIVRSQAGTTQINFNVCNINNNNNTNTNTIMPGGGQADVLEGVLAFYIKDYKPLGSRESLCKEILDVLEGGDGVRMIGVHGMGGIGKTTLVKRVAAQAKTQNPDLKVIMVSVTQNADLKKIQREIAEQLGLELKEESETVRAERLCKRLMQEKKILIILDDLWKKLNLIEVGIPDQDQLGGCKLLLTSRNDEVLDCQKIFSVGVLSENEAWDLFQKMASSDKFETQDIRSVATKVARECAGLPVAIVTVASALKNKSLPAWRNALRELQRPSPSNFEGTLAVAYTCIKLSYKSLESVELRSTFLLCSLISHKGNLEDLLKYGMGLGLFGDFVALEEARDKADWLVNKLKASCLLLEGDTRLEFTMHDVVRGVARSLASQDHHVFVKSTHDVVELKCPDDDTCQQISLHGNIIKIPEKLVCPQLKFLYLNGIGDILYMPFNFFGEIPKLKVLVLANFSLASLPSSLTLLVNLQTLCLDSCELGDIAVIGGLENLEILSLKGSSIEILPREIGKLSKLKLLDLRNSSELRVIPSNILSKLSLLEELLIGNSFTKWNIQGQNNAKFIELRQISQLTHLEICIPSINVMPDDLFFKNLQKYEIVIGSQTWENCESYDTIRKLALNLDTSIHSKHGVQMLLKNTDDLHLDELVGIKNIIYDLTKQGFPELKCLRIHNNSNIENIMNGVHLEVFPKLESFSFTNLASLKKICDRDCKLGESSFCKLKVLKVEHCEKLESLFPFEVAKSLLKLEEIIISDCQNMEEIIVEESEANVNDAKIEFIQLRYMCLQCLPHLKNFCSNGKTPLKETISNDDKISPPTSLFNEKVAFPNLEKLTLLFINIEKLWHDEKLPPTAISFQNLKTLEVMWCNSLKYLFSSSMVQSLVHLTHLIVFDCELMEEIVVMVELGEEGMAKMLLQKLESLELRKLPELKQFYTDSLIEYPSLKKLSIVECPQLKIAFLNTEKQWHDDELPKTACSFQNLKTLNLAFCNSIKYLFSSSMVQSLVQLTHLLVEQCELIEEIVIMEELGEERMCKMLFLKLESLELRNLPELAQFCADPTRAEAIVSTKTQEVNMLGNSPNATQALFDEKVAFSSLTYLFIEHLDNMVKLWNSQQATNSFCKLTQVTIRNCEKLVNVFPSHILGRFHTLEKLTVQNCGSLEEIFDIQGLLVEEVQQPIKGFELANLDLSLLAKLKHIWNTDPQGLLSFQKLHTIDVMYCAVLENIFPFSIAKDLARLEKLTLRECGIKEIVAKEGNIAEEKPHHFVLPRLTSLNLKEIRMCRSFYPGTHTWKCPMLKRLDMSDSSIVKFYSSEFEILEECHRDSPNGQVFFPFGKVMVFPNLKELYLVGWNAVSNILWNSQFSAVLKVLKFGSLGDELAKDFLLPFSVFQRLTNLQDLELTYSSIKRLFGHEEERPETLARARLRCLKLSVVHGLRRIWEQHHPFFGHDLQTLVVVNCNTLVNLAPPSASFQNLTDLCVRWCGGLPYLMTTSTAKSLVQLVRLEVEHCLRMTEIIKAAQHETEEGDNAIEKGDHHEIIFPKLESLQILSLGIIAGFYLGNYALNFPSLRQVIVNKCPKMTIFSSGVMTTPKLRRVQCNQNKVYWDDNLNTTLQQGIFFGKRDLKISEFPLLKEIWHNKLPVKFFTYLELLVVDECANFDSAIPPKLLESIHDLQILGVKNCDTLKVVFDLEGINVDNVSDGLLPGLTELHLIDLPQLRHIWNNNPRRILNFRWLQLLEIHNCNSLTTVFTPCMAVSLVRLEKMSITNCGMMEAIISREGIRDAAPQNMVFPLLRSVILKSLPKLTCIYSGNEVVEFPSLENITMDNSPIMKTFFSSFLRELKPTAVVSNQEVALPSLEKLNMECNDTVKEIEHGKFQAQFLSKLQVLEHTRFPNGLRILLPSSATFQYLEILKVSKCHQLIHLMTSKAAKCLVKLTTMSITKCKMIRQIIANEEHDVENEAIFHNLNYLRLHCLHNLTSFCLGNCKFVFPSLTKVLVSECPNMTYFSEGNTSTPMLKRVLVKMEEQEEEEKEEEKEEEEVKEEKEEEEVEEEEEEKEEAEEEEEEGYWEGNLDATIQKLFLKRGHKEKQPRLPSSPKKLNLDYEETQGEGLTFEDLDTFEISHASKDLLSKDEIDIQEQAIQNALEESESISQSTTKAMSRNLTSNAASKLTSSQETNKFEAPKDEAMPTFSIPQSCILTISSNTTVEPIFESTSKFAVVKATSSQDLNYGVASISASSQATNKYETQKEQVLPASSIPQSSIAPISFGTKSSTKATSSLELTSSTSFGPSSCQRTHENETVSEQEVMSASSTPRTNTVLVSSTVTVDDYFPESTSESAAEEISTQDLSFGIPCRPSSSQATNKDETQKEKILPRSSVLRSDIIPTSSSTIVEQISKSAPHPTAKATFSQYLTSTTTAKSTSGTPSVPIAKISSYSKPPFPSREQVLNQGSAMSSSFDAYKAVIRKISMKSLAEVAKSTDCLLMLAALKNLKNCLTLNSQQLEIIEVYIENLYSLVRDHSFYELHLEMNNSLKLSIDEKEKGLAELENHYEDLTRKASTLSAEKEALIKRLRELEEEENNVQQAAKDVYAQWVTASGELETHLNALPEADEQEREAKEKSHNASNDWAKNRDLFARAFGLSS